MQPLKISLDCDYSVTNKIITLFGGSGDEIEYLEHSHESSRMIFGIPFAGNSSERALIEQIVTTVATELFAKKAPVGEIKVMPRIPDHMFADYQWFFPPSSKVVSYDWEIENVGILARKYESTNPAYTNLIWEFKYGDAILMFAVVRRQHTMTTVYGNRPGEYLTVSVFEHDISKQTIGRGIGTVRAIDPSGELPSLGVILKLSRV